MENSKVLLDKAISIINEASVPKRIYSVGGGTVLSFFYNHRVSKDIDIFINDPQFLSSISPRLNNNAEEALDYDENNNFISLTFPKGKIDFIVSPSVTKFNPIQENFLGFDISVDDPVEIVCKKMFFRGEKALPRDIFDLAVILESNRRNDLLLELSKMPEKVGSFFSMNKKLPTKELYSLKNADMLLPDGRKFQGKELKICQQAILSMLKQHSIKPSRSSFTR